MGEEVLRLQQAGSMKHSNPIAEQAVGHMQLVKTLATAACGLPLFQLYFTYQKTTFIQPNWSNKPNRQKRNK